MTSLPASSVSQALAQETAALTHAVLELTACGGDLADCMREKQRVLVRHELAQLEPVAEREAQLATRFQQLERERQAAQAALSTQLGLDGRSATLSSMLAALAGVAGQESDEDSLQLHTACFGLADQLAVLAQLNADNAHLSANTLEYTRMLLGALSGSGAQPAYGSDGKVASGKAQELVSLRA